MKNLPTFFLLFRRGAVDSLLLLKIEIQFPLNYFSLLWPIGTKPAVWVAYIKTQFGPATQVSVIKFKVTVTKNRNSVYAL